MHGVLLHLLAAATAAAAGFAVPTARQLQYHQQELAQFVHFGVSSFETIDCSGGRGCAALEWNCLNGQGVGAWDGDRVYPASMFNPTALNASQWVATAKLWGAKEVCLTAKHVGGFTLWPTALYDYGVHSSPWLGGKGDVVREFVAACRAQDVLPCFYFIGDWNCYNWNATVPEFMGNMTGMLTELLTGYGPISRVWFDVYKYDYKNVSQRGQNPGGFPAAYQTLVDHVRAVSPETLVLSGADGCESTDENGFAPYPLWNPQSVPNDAAAEFCNPSPTGQYWRPMEVDLSIQNPGDNWFYHPNAMYLNASQLWQHYVATVGQGASLMINAPPDTRGLIPEKYVQELAMFGKALESLATPLAELRLAAPVPLQTAVELLLPNVTFNAVVLREDLSKGQKIQGYALEACDAAGQACVALPAHGQTVGNKVLDLVGGRSGFGLLRVTCTAALAPEVDLLSVAVYLARPPA